MSREIHQITLLSTGFAVSFAVKRARENAVFERLAWSLMLLEDAYET
jgi:hypothetical protein